MKKLSLQQIFDRAEKVNYGFVKDYIENKNLDGKSYLGSGVEGIKKIPLKINLHHSFCNPQEVIDEIEEKMKNKTVTGYYQNGNYICDVVISDYKVNVKQMIGDSIIYAEIEVTLLESVDMPEISTVSSLPLQTFSSDSGIVQKFVENAKNLQYQNVISQVVKMSVSDNLSSSAQQIFNNFKDSLINVFANEGLSKVYDKVSQYIDSLEQNPNIEYVEKEFIKYALRNIPRVITNAFIRTTVNDTPISTTLYGAIEIQQWIWPLSYIEIRSKFGWRIHPKDKVRKFHNGIDLGTKKKVNIPVYAVADGKVIKAEWFNGYGNYIEIQHSNNIISFYGHLNQIDVKKNDIVTQGNKIGLSGNTGKSTGPHLHFGVYKDGKPDDPLKYLPKF